MEPEKTLVLRASLEVPSFRPYDPAEGRPRFFVDSSWAFVLEPLASRTRVLVRTRSAGRPGLLGRLAGFFLFDPAHYVMQTRQLVRVRRLAESCGADQMRRAVGRGAAFMAPYCYERSLPWSRPPTGSAAENATSATAPTATR